MFATFSTTDMKEPLDVRMSDFDNVAYHVSVNPETPGVLQVSMTCSCWDQLKSLGAEEQLKSLYGDMLVSSDSSAHVTLRIDLNNPVDNKGMLFQSFFACCRLSGTENWLLCLQTS
jgi:hypothetical protein